MNKSTPNNTLTPRCQAHKGRIVKWKRGQLYITLHQSSKGEAYKTLSPNHHNINRLLLCLIPSGISGMEAVIYNVNKMPGGQYADNVQHLEIKRTKTD